MSKKTTERYKSRKYKKGIVSTIYETLKRLEGKQKEQVQQLDETKKKKSNTELYT